MGAAISNASAMLLHDFEPGRDGTPVQPEPFAQFEAHHVFETVQHGGFIGGTRSNLRIAMVAGLQGQIERRNRAQKPR